MQTITKEELEKKKFFFKEELEKKVFIHPTDTVYGLGGNATDKEVVAKIRAAKHSNLQPFSVIAPSKKWITENCIIDDEAERWLEKLPGPYTLILPLKNKNCVAPNVTNNHETIGVRIPNHWIKDVIAELNLPFITTSANVTAEEVMTNIEDMGSQLKPFIDYAIDDEVIKGHSSTLVNLAQETVSIKKR